MQRLMCMVALLLIGLSSCVPSKKLQEAQERYEQCDAALEKANAELVDLQAEVKDLRSENEVIKRQMEALKQDTSVLGSSLRILRSQYDKINALNEELLQKSASLRQGSEAENKKLMEELGNLRDNLLAKEDSLIALQKTLSAKEDKLIEREQALEDLRSMLSERDSAMNALKSRISNALLGFEGKGLNVEKRNGRIYVSMEAKLLFPSGSTKIDPEGKRAIVDLAEAIQDEDDLTIMVEGHTDTDKITSSKIPTNNWELSVLRATAVIEHMLEKSTINPQRLIAAGRSEFHPVDPADKSRNRRIEVIIYPKLDDLLEVVSENKE